MTIVETVKTLLFDPKTFFTDPTVNQSLKLPMFYTGILAVLTAISSYSTSASVGDAMGMSNMSGVLGAIGAVTGFITIFITWLIITVLFFIFIKLFTHTKTGLKPFLAVTGYASLPILIGTVLSLLVNAVAVDAFNGWMGFILNLVVLFWCLPIWIYGFSTVSDAPVRAVATALLIPLIIMIAFSMWNVATSLEAMNTVQSTTSGLSSGSMQGPPSAGRRNF